MADYKEKNYKASKGKKHNLRSQSKHHNQKWQGCWNYQTRNLKTMINMLTAVMDKADSMHEQMSNINRDVEILRKNQKEMLEIKIT